MSKLIFLIPCLLLLACTADDSLNYKTLNDYLNAHTNLLKDEVIACAASSMDDSNTSYIFYYPIEGAYEIKYFETNSVNVDKDNFNLYKEQDLDMHPVFNGYLQRFERDNPNEVWCVVTYKTQAKLHKSNPIRLKHKTSPTNWYDSVLIDFSETNMPKFVWSDYTDEEDAIYFQVVTDVDDNLLSGTYTYDDWFQYYKVNNVVLNITTQEPPNLEVGEQYGFTMMGVSLDNWVNTVIQKPFALQ